MTIYSMPSNFLTETSRLVAEQTEPVAGLEELCRWVEDNGLRRAAVTNAPRENAELMISLLGLEKFFELVVIGNECERQKPFPDPYLTALRKLGLSAEHTFVFEVWLAFLISTLTHNNVL